MSNLFPSLYEFLTRQQNMALQPGMQNPEAQPTGPLYDDAAKDDERACGIDFPQVVWFDHAAGLDMPSQAQGYMMQPPKLFVEPAPEAFVRKDMTFFVLVDDNGEAVGIFNSYAEASDAVCFDEQIVKVDGQGFVLA